MVANAGGGVVVSRVVMIVMLLYRVVIWVCDDRRYICEWEHKIIDTVVMARLKSN